MTLNSKSRKYSIRFIYNNSFITVNISEVAFAGGMVAYVVRFDNYKGLFLQKESNWKVLSKVYLSNTVKLRLIQEIKFHGRLLSLMDKAIVRPPLFT